MQNVISFDVGVRDPITRWWQIRCNCVCVCLSLPLSLSVSCFDPKSWLWLEFAWTICGYLCHPVTTKFFHNGGSGDCSPPCTCHVFRHGNCARPKTQHAATPPHLLIYLMIVSFHLSGHVLTTWCSNPWQKTWGSQLRDALFWPNRQMFSRNYQYTNGSGGFLQSCQSSGGNVLHFQQSSIHMHIYIYTYLCAFGRGWLWTIASGFPDSLWSLILDIDVL